MSAALDNFCHMDSEKPKDGLPRDSITVERRSSGRVQSDSVEGRQGV